MGFRRKHAFNCRRTGNFSGACPAFEGPSGLWGRVPSLRLRKIFAQRRFPQLQFLNCFLGILREQKGQHGAQ